MAVRVSVGVATASLAAMAQTPTPVMTPVMSAVFVLPQTPLAMRSEFVLRACQATFERALRVATANAASRRPVSPEELMLAPLPPSVVTTGQRCIQSLQSPDAVRALAPGDLPVLLRLATGVNADALVEDVVARQLAIAGTDVRARGHVLAGAVAALLHNRWGSEPSARATHRTAAHDALATHYATILDTLQPAGLVLASRLGTRRELYEALAPAGWDVDRELAFARAQLQTALSVPLSAVSPEDINMVKNSRAPTGVAWLAYLQRPTHANLAQWIAARDSVLRVPKGQALDSLINHPAPQLDGDYWFNVPGGKPAPIVPAPGVVSLLLFGNDLDSAGAAKLRTWHATYPRLQIILVAMTRGYVGAQELRDQPAREATLIAHHLTDELHLPGAVCVIVTKYHTEVNATDIPMASPVLDRFHLDPRDYAGRAFLIDADGWLLEDRTGPIWDGKLLQRVFHH